MQANLWDDAKFLLLFLYWMFNLRIFHSACKLVTKSEATLVFLKWIGSCALCPDPAMASRLLLWFEVKSLVIVVYTVVHALCVWGHGFGSQHEEMGRKSGHHLYTCRSDVPRLLPSPELSGCKHHPLCLLKLSWINFPTLQAGWLGCLVRWLIHVYYSAGLICLCLITIR